jgi:hypothetical protein
MSLICSNLRQYFCLAYEVLICFKVSEFADEA